jgi:hypothetical protein
MRTFFVLLIGLCAILALHASPNADSSASADTSTLSAEQRYRLDSIAATRAYDLREMELHQQRQPDPEDIIGVFIPIVAILGAFLVVWRSIESKRALRMAMIDKGMDPSLLEAPTDESSKKFGALRFGMLLAGVGFGLMLAIFIVSFWETGQYESAVFFGSALLFGGVGLVAYHIIARRLEK